MMLKNSFCRTTCAVLSLLILSPDPSPADDANRQEYLLQYRFHRDEIVGYAVDNNSRVFLQQQQAEQHIEHGSLTNKRYTVKSVEADGTAVLDLQIDRVRLTASVDGGDSVAYDTNSGEDPPEAFQGISATVGQPHVRIKVSPRGELLSLNWLIASAQTEKPTKDDAASLDIMVLLPEKPVAIGETWKETFAVEVNATETLKKKINLQREYTLMGVDGNRATIALKTVVLTPLHDPAQESQLVSKTPKGTIVFDITRGVIVSRTHSIDKVVVGFSGADSKVHTIVSRKEQLAPVAVAVEAAAEAPVRK